MVRVVGLGSQDPEFKSHSAVELIPGGVDSACHPSEVGKMSASLLVRGHCISGKSRVPTNDATSSHRLHSKGSQQIAKSASRKFGGAKSTIWIRSGSNLISP